MQITGLPITLSSPAHSQRPDVTERLQKDIQRDTNRTEDNRSQSSFGEASAFRDGFQQQVESTERPAAVYLQRQPEQEGLSLNVRRALQAFADNSPSAEQQLGIELAGIDTFV